VRKKSLRQTDVSNCSVKELAVKGSDVDCKDAQIVVTLGLLTQGKERTQTQVQEQPALDGCWYPHSRSSS